MDPSSNNSFGSFSSGGISGGNDFVGGEQPVDNGLNVATNSAVTDNGGAATNNFGAQVPRASDAGAGVFGATGIAPGAAVNASVGVGAASAPAPAPQAQPQMTQTQFSTQPQFPMRPQVVASGTGDVVLGGVEPKKSKKWLVVVAVLTLTVIIGVLVVLAVGIATDKDEEKGERNFNIFANYILYGEVDDSRDLETGLADQYVLNGIAFHGGDRAKEFYSVAMKYWRLFENTYPEKNKEITDKVTEISNELMFLEQFTENGLIENSKLLEAYYRGGEDSVIDEYAKYYLAFRKDHVAFREFMIIQDTYVDNAVQLLNLYNQNGCIVDVGEDLECIEAKQLTNNSYYVGTISVGKKTAQYVSSVEADLANDIVELNSLIVKEGEREK